jgi:hypothetical protein
MSDSESSESFIDCELIGDAVYEDSETKYRFYVEVMVNGRRITIGDVVQVHLDVLNESDTIHALAGQYSDDYAYGVILALFEDAESVVHAEIRWLLTKRELSARLRKL